jgi:ERF superfamily
MPDEMFEEADQVVVSPVRRSASIGQIAEALAKASLEFEEVAKDTQNPFYKSRYADLAALIRATRPFLGKHSLVVTQFPLMAGNRAGATTLIIHKSGEWMESDLTLPIAKADAQGSGSAITYARRYAYQGILNVAGEDDDDGNAASGKKPEKVSEAEDAWSTKAGGKAAPNLVSAFEAMFKTSGKTREQLATILRTRYSAGSPSDLTRDELGELVKWAASKEPLQATLETSVAAATKTSGEVLGHKPTRTLISNPESATLALERVLVRVKDIAAKKLKKAPFNPYLILECFNDEHPENFDVFSWDTKINEHLLDAKGKMCIFEIERKPKGISLKHLVEVDRIKFENDLPILDVDAVLGR